MSKMSKIKIAITGSIGSGKSTVKKLLIQKGYPVFDADEAVAYLYENNKDLIKTFEHEFEGVVIDHKINKEALKVYLVKYPHQLKVIESIVHPYVLEAYFKFERQALEPIVFAEIPLLFEVGWETYFDVVWCIYTKQARIIDRLIKHRKMTQSAILKMLSLQLSPEKKCAMSSIVLYNDEEIDDLEAQIDAQLELLEREVHEING